MTSDLELVTEHCLLQQFFVSINDYQGSLGYVVIGRFQVQTPPESKFKKASNCKMVLIKNVSFDVENLALASVN